MLYRSVSITYIILRIVTGFLFARDGAQQLLGASMAL